jgi:hypothetical protein
MAAALLAVAMLGKRPVGGAPGKPDDEGLGDIGLQEGP